MSFAEDVKNELCQYQTDSDLNSCIELSCLLRMGGSILLGMQGRVGIRFSTANNAVARRVLSILRGPFHLPTNIVVRKGLNLRKKNMYTITVDPSEDGVAALRKMQLWPVDASIPKEWLKTMESERAFLRGAFLGGGSVNKPQSDYHLEFMTGNSAFANQLINVLKSFHLNAGLTERKETFVVYLKEGDAVTTCLQVMGATSAMMEFENVRVMKDMRNQVNRQVNCETANLQKTVNAAVRQLESIRIIERHMSWEEVPSKLREVADVRLAYPDASLQEIMELLGGSLSKSGISHRFKKLEAMALDFEPEGLSNI